MTGYEPQAALEASADILMSIHQLQLDMNGSPIPVTVSAGLASFYPGEAPEAVLEHAEHALAEAKSAGGGTVQLHQPDDELHALSL
ncbi:MAG: diguanylate cyclase [Rhizobiales bacterium]|nr:diguanylate cyclase [Hyphomicrobiales bacterium]